MSAYILPCCRQCCRQFFDPLSRSVSSIVLVAFTRALHVSIKENDGSNADDDVKEEDDDDDDDDDDILLSTTRRE